MKRALSVAMAVCIGVFSGGCGTVCNTAGGVLHPDEEPRVYGGVQRDLEGNLYCLKLGSQPLHEGCTLSDGKGAVLLLALVPVEFGLTFVGDTLTLPITIPLQERREAANNGDKEAR
jgi:Protein of unknown function (DUF1375)